MNSFIMICKYITSLLMFEAEPSSTQPTFSILLYCHLFIFCWWIVMFSFDKKKSINRVLIIAIINAVRTVEIYFIFSSLAAKYIHWHEAWRNTTWGWGKAPLPWCQEKAEAMVDLVLLCCWSVGLGQGQELPVQTLCLRLLKLLHSRTLCSLPPRKT